MIEPEYTVLNFKDKNSYYEIKENTIGNFFVETKFNDISLGFKINERSKILLLLKIKDTEKLNLKINVSRDSEFSLIICDLCNSNLNFSTDIDLDEENSVCCVKSFSLASNKSLKKYAIKINHKVRKCLSDIEFSAVSKDNSQIKVDAITHIYENAIKSNASQNIRIGLYDDYSLARAEPILKIDNNDVKASHNCAIGSIDEEYIYYFLTRGIDKENAKKMLSLSYLIPVLDYFDEVNKNEISDIFNKEF